MSGGVPSPPAPRGGRRLVEPVWGLIWGGGGGGGRGPGRRRLRVAARVGGGGGGLEGGRGLGGRGDVVDPPAIGDWPVEGVELLLLVVSAEQWLSGLSRELPLFLPPLLPSSRGSRRDPAGERPIADLTRGVPCGDLVHTISIQVQAVAIVLLLTSRLRRLSVAAVVHGLSSLAVFRAATPLRILAAATPPCIL